MISTTPIFKKYLDDIFLPLSGIPEISLIMHSQCTLMVSVLVACTFCFKYLLGVKSHDFGGQSTLPQLEMIRLTKNCSQKDQLLSQMDAMLHHFVETMFRIFMYSNFFHKYVLIIFRYEAFLQCIYENYTVSQPTGPKLH